MADVLEFLTRLYLSGVITRCSKARTRRCLSVSSQYALQQLPENLYVRCEKRYLGILSLNLGKLDRRMFD